MRRNRRRQSPVQDGDSGHDRQRLQVLHRIHPGEVQGRARIRSWLRQGLCAGQQRVPARAHQARLPALRAVPHLARQGDGGGLAHRQVHARGADAAGQGPQDRARDGRHGAVLRPRSHHRRKRGAEHAARDPHQAEPVLRGRRPHGPAARDAGPRLRQVQGVLQRGDGGGAHGQGCGAQPSGAGSGKAVIHHTRRTAYG